MSQTKKPIPLKKLIGWIAAAAWIFVATEDRVYFISDRSHDHDGRNDDPRVWVDLEELPGHPPEPQVHLGITGEIVHRNTLYHPTVGERCDVYLSLDRAFSLAHAILDAVKHGRQAKKSQGPG